MAPGTRGKSPGVIFALLSRRLRTFVLLSVLAPVAGRVLHEAADRVSDRNPRAAHLLHRGADVARNLKPGRREATA